MGAANNHNQSSGALLQKSYFYKFCKIHKKTPKKRFRHRCFLVNSAKFLIASWRRSFGRLLQHKNSFCLLSHHHLFAFSKTMSHLFSGWVFFRFNISIFQTFSQKPIFNPVENLRWNFFTKIVNSLKALSIFAKKSFIVMFARF